MVNVEGYEVLEGLYYSKEWIWVKVEDGRARIGVTDYAQKQMREIVFAELPSVGAEVRRGEPFGTLESVKAVSDLVSPLSGRIVEVNGRVSERPELINEDPYGEGWLIVVEPANLREDLKALMTFEQAVEWHREIAKKS
ncbi:MAG: glycine cleavage system protein GcvH [Candidatus Bathyarchaeota archaeon]|nr:glycine cleavage system protein GcvH [Candidatus Bathyarchaeota archaeon]